MIIVAPTAFKEALGPVAAARAIATGLKSSLKRKKIELYPLSDGGDGFLECISYYFKGQRLRNVTLQVTDPAGGQIKTTALISGRQAFIESASILGLRLVAPQERDPLKTTSKGLGEAILALLDKGMEEVVVGLGGSATVDGGRDALEVLGVRFLDSKDNPLGPGPAELTDLERIDLSGIDPRVKKQVLILWDVDSPLLGPYGALIYAPQKGAGQKDLKALELSLQRYAEVAELAIAQRLDHRRGMGAAGGIAFGFAVLAGCKLMSGADYLLRLSGLRDKLKKEDIVISGEGRLDKQSLSYKVIGALRRLPHSKLILLCGEIGVQIAPRDRRTAAISIQPGPIDRSKAIAATKENLKQTATQIGRLLA
ncbi:Glycerate 2-kinase [subsurface metagenome]|nr:glycerate kinase [bacterium]